MTPTETMIMRVVSSCQPISISSIAKFLGLRETIIEAALESLERQGEVKGLDERLN